jgi:methylthioribose-1-phosphate isomerase
MLVTVQDAASKPGANSNSVNTAFITATAAMLELDITANKQQGHYGVEAIKQDCAHLLMNDSTSSSSDCKAISVLTHCNTGSLACAGYGTALGVIRTLHAQGMLKACYACETRYTLCCLLFTHYMSTQLMVILQLATCSMRAFYVHCTCLYFTNQCCVYYNACMA